MATLNELKAAAAALPLEQQRELLLFLVTRLRAGSAQHPLPRRFSCKQINAWIADDGEAMRRLRCGD